MALGNDLYNVHPCGRYLAVQAHPVMETVLPDGLDAGSIIQVSKSQRLIVFIRMFSVGEVFRH